MKRSGLVRTVASIGVLTSALGALLRAQTTERVSVGNANAYVEGIAGSYRPSISADGRFVAFDSDSIYLVTSDTNGWRDVFVRDRQTATTEYLSIAYDGSSADADSDTAVISANGRYVAFDSYASNLVPNHSNEFDVYVRDRVTMTTELVSVSTSGVAGNHASQMPAISADGRYVAFYSYASNFVPGDTYASCDVFVRDRVAGTTEIASVSSTGAIGGDFYTVGRVSISADGRYVAFSSGSANLVPGDTNGQSDVFVRDRLNLTTERVSLASSGAQANLHCLLPEISADGRYVAFFADATNLVAGDTNSVRDVFVRDRLNGTTERVSIATGGAEADAACQWSVISISGDGRYVVFASGATNLVGNDTNSARDVFVRDRLNGTTKRASVASNAAEGNADSGNYAASISSDGRYVAFDSLASNLIAIDANWSSDAFVRDGGLLYPGVFCTAGTTTNGCAASITGTGTPSASSGAGFTIRVNSVEGQKQGLLFYGLDNLGFSAAPWGTSTSYLCVKSPTQRTAPLNSGGASGACDGALDIDWNAFVAANPSALGQPFAAGQHVFVQGWFRDPPSEKTTALSNAIEFVVGL